MRRKGVLFRRLLSAVHKPLATSWLVLGCCCGVNVLLWLDPHGLTCLHIVQANQKAPFRLLFSSQSLPIVHHSTGQSASDTGVVRGPTLVVQ